MAQREINVIAKSESFGARLEELRVDFRNASTHGEQSAVLTFFLQRPVKIDDSAREMPIMLMLGDIRAFKHRIDAHIEAGNSFDMVDLMAGVFDRTLDRWSVYKEMDRRRS